MPWLPMTDVVVTAFAEGVISAGEASGTWNPLYSLYTLLGLNRPTPIPASATTPPPLTECRRAWFGLTPLVLNPVFTNVQDIDKLAQGTAGVDWTHAGDLVNVYGTDASGFGRSPWDNVGVQYGLQALKDGVPAREVWLAICQASDVPAQRRYGVGIREPRES